MSRTLALLAELRSTRDVLGDAIAVGADPDVVTDLMHQVNNTVDELTGHPESRSQHVRMTFRSSGRPAQHLDLVKTLRRNPQFRRYYYVETDTWDDGSRFDSTQRAIRFDHMSIGRPGLAGQWMTSADRGERDWLMAQDHRFEANTRYWTNSIAYRPAVLLDDVGDRDGGSSDG